MPTVRWKNRTSVLLGEPMIQFHESLAAEARRNPRFHYHYVTAREMYNLARAAADGFEGPVGEALNYELLAGPCVYRVESEQMSH
jgi:hypothetical protein